MDNPTQITIIADRKSDKEPDILAGFEKKDLLLVSESGDQVVKAAPPAGWTFATLEAAAIVELGEAWDAYLGDRWIGSTEV